MDEEPPKVYTWRGTDIERLDEQQLRYALRLAIDAAQRLKMAQLYQEQFADLTHVREKEPFNGN